MKNTVYLVSAATAAVVGLSACSGSPSIRVKSDRASELSTIKHVCIIPNPKRMPNGFEKNLAEALASRNITSEVVPAENNQRLYEAECKYNLRYISVGSQDSLKKVTLILRTPEYAVASIGYKRLPEHKSSTLQQQTDYIVNSLFNGSAAR